MKKYLLAALSITLFASGVWYYVVVKPAVSDDQSGTVSVKPAEKTPKMPALSGLDLAKRSTVVIGSDTVALKDGRGTVSGGRPVRLERTYLSQDDRNGENGSADILAVTETDGSTTRYIAFGLPGTKLSPAALITGKDARILAMNADRGLITLDTETSAGKTEELQFAIILGSDGFLLNPIKLTASVN